MNSAAYRCSWCSKYLGKEYMPGRQIWDDTLYRRMADVAQVTERYGSYVYRSYGRCDGCMRVGVRTTQVLVKTLYLLGLKAEVVLR